MQSWGWGGEWGLMALSKRKRKVRMELGGLEDVGPTTDGDLEGEGGAGQCGDSELRVSVVNVGVPCTGVGGRRGCVDKCGTQETLWETAFRCFGERIRDAACGLEDVQGELGV